MAQLDRVLDRIDRGLDASLERLFALLRIPSISTDPADAGHCRAAGQWIADELTAMGFVAGLRDTPGHPIVVGHYSNPGVAADAPHVLFYGHYDVQPADPLEKWNTPPFEPELRTGSDGIKRIYARGANDDKGQLMTFLEASRAWIAETGSLPLNVSVIFEGEEESGSPSLDPFLKANRDELRKDVALVCDTNMWDPETAAITTRLRGLVHDEVIVTGPRIDLHSGLFGGAAHNAIHVLSDVLAALHDGDGRVMIPGFYDGVDELPPATRAQWQALDFSEAEFLADVGLKHPAGEKGRMLLEQIWSRPTAEINGIIGGYTGAGSKTVIPSQASAKLSFRLVGRQDPAHVIDAFRQFVRDRIPEGCKAEFIGKEHGSQALTVPEDDRHLAKASAALAQEFGKPAVMMGCGGSIPVVRSFQDILDIESLLVGFGLPDDALHSPNEKYNLSSFHRGARSWARIMAALA